MSLFDRAVEDKESAGSAIYGYKIPRLARLTKGTLSPEFWNKLGNLVDARECVYYFIFVHHMTDN